MELLKQRRIWASLAAIIALVLPMFGYTDLNPESLTEAIMTIINGISALASIVLPIWSYLKPKE